MSQLTLEALSTTTVGFNIFKSRLANVWSQIKQISVIFTHLKLLFTAVRHNFELLNKMDISKCVNMISQQTRYIDPMLS